MAKTITLTDVKDGQEYTLEYSRKTVQEMEKQGFIAQELLDKPMTYLPQLFRGAFKKNHRHVQPNVCDRLYDAISNKEDFVPLLVEMYQEPISAMMASVDEETEGNVTWGKNW